MSLKIVNVSKSNLFTVESDLGDEKTGFKGAHAELMHPDTKKWVQKEAADKHGLPNPTLGLTHGAPYAVDANGVEIGANVDTPIHRFRTDVQINAG